MANQSKKPNQNTRQGTQTTKPLFNAADFYEFLTEYNILFNYKRALGDEDYTVTVTTFFRVNSGDQLICSTFNWDNSLEGYDFWVEINEKWNKRINKFYETRKI